MPEPSTMIPANNDWPGQRLGLPEHGPRSVARPGRRIAALAIDFAIAAILWAAFFPNEQWASTLIFVGMQILFIPLLSGGIGHLCVGLRVVTLNGTWVGVLRPIIRTLLLALLVPALIWDADQRGLHDKLAGTVLVRV
ncbi:RDD family protein [Salinibacterium sp. dk2585]|uniref:RDD family protein n=1 Tax=unclassified Salinibacterium TaxID=2632331 RepID=UPI0011C2433F|nr:MULTISPECIES: RDD family protein [unclassified Salinibacterium]QEE61335.1 RDD family protein [Salinibacterium sp. dk2585]TXK54012.1 RDD family protein [Salinibacterium sp. dk5596]